MEKLKVGIIGCGGIGNVHARTYKCFPDECEIVAACDIDEEKLAKFAENHGIARTYTDFDEMMKKEKLDCVSVCTWNSAHASAAIAALDGGANVICEKPMAMNAAEAEEMQKARDRSGKILMIGFCRRFGDDCNMMLDFIKSGNMGDIYYAKATYLRRNGFPGGWFGDSKYSRGGPLIDLGVHVMDLVRYLAGCPKPVEAFGVTYNNLGLGRAKGEPKAWHSSTKGNFKYDVEDFCSAMVRFDNGLTLVLETSFNLNLKKDTGYVDIFGTKAGAHMENGIELYTDIAGHFINATPTGRTTFDFDGIFRGEIKSFLECVRGEHPCVTPAEDGVAIMKIIDAIYESAKTGKSVSIK